MRTKISKRHSSLKSLSNYVKHLLNFLLSVLHKNTVSEFWRFAFTIPVFLHTESYGATISTGYSFTSLFNYSKLLLNFLFNCLQKRYSFEFLKFCFFRFFRPPPPPPEKKIKLTIVTYREVKVLQVSRAGAIVDRNGVRFGPGPESWYSNTQTLAYQ